MKMHPAMRGNKNGLPPMAAGSILKSLPPDKVEQNGTVIEGGDNINGT